MSSDLLFRPPPNVIWNIFLALIPVALAFVAARVGPSLRTQPRLWLAQIPVLLIWLAFLPNSPYLLTEWRHYLETISETELFHQAARQGNRDALMDLLMSTTFYVLYSGIGLISYFLAIWPLDRMVRISRPRYSVALLAIFFFLCALGVYLGLVLRFNSWDLLHPIVLRRIVRSSIETLAHPLRFVLIAGFGGILWLAYACFDLFMDGLLGRLNRAKELRS